MDTQFNLFSVRNEIVRIWKANQAQRHRTLLVIHGPARNDLVSLLFQETHTGINELNQMLPLGEILSLGETKAAHPFSQLWPKRMKHTLSWSNARSRLGGTESALLIDLSQGLDPDALSANLGVVGAGGLVLILLPNQPPTQSKLKEKLRIWSQSHHEVGTLFWERIWTSLLSFSQLEFVHPQISISISDQQKLVQPEPIQVQILEAKTSSVSPKDRMEYSEWIAQSCYHSQQYKAVLQIIHSHQREAFTAVALTAGRGRGKSSVLGIAAASLLLLGESEIYVTASHDYACETLFKHAFLLLEKAQQAPVLEQRTLKTRLGQIRFVDPNEIWSQKVSPSILFVDEAATLPVPFLERLLDDKPSLVFATTTHGYEGTGRGFSLRFRPFLQKKLRKLYEPHLSSPIRWAAYDPVEVWSAHALLLEAKIKKYSLDELFSQPAIYHQVSKDELKEHVHLYEQVFALLINAHYRTQPSDLWRILDAPNLSLHVLMTQSSSVSKKEIDRNTIVLAAAIVSTEGELPGDLASQLYEGRERPRGQLFAANFAVHLNCEEAACFRLNRIVRIATLPSIQCQGWGSALLRQIKEQAQESGVDLIGSSFGATQQLARFWSKAGYIPLRVSVRQSHVSGERSLLVAQGLSTRGLALIDSLLPALKQECSEQLGSGNDELSPELVFHIYAEMSRQISLRGLSQVKASLFDLNEREWKALGAVAFSGRAYELAMGPARRLTLDWIEKQSVIKQDISLLTPLAQLLIMKVIQAQGWRAITQHLKLGSTSETMKGLSAALRLLYRECAPSWALEWVQRFPQYHQPSILSHVFSEHRLLKDAKSKSR